MEVVVAEAVVSRVADEVVDSLWRQIGYIWNYKGNFQDLKKQLKKLKDQRQSMDHSVDEARRNGEEIEDIVINWLKSADEAIQVAEEILKDNDSANKSYFLGCCPNLKNRHQFSRKAKKEITPVLAEVEGERNSITKISYRLDVQELEPTKDYEALASRMDILKEIMGALKNVDVNFIGVYGLGGVGKTTLVKQQVVTQVKEEGIFKVVAIANVTHTCNLNKIQQEIADWLGLKFDVESTEVRAARLRARLKQEQKVLLILDDIWVRFKLEEIGIPDVDDHKGCKILMTSRNLNALLEMGVQRHFLLKVLGEEEARQLFVKKAGNQAHNSRLRSIAIQVAKRCAGLPVLIVAVATALKNKALFEWEDSLRRLKESDHKEFEDQVHTVLELSYKYLSDNEKSLLLLCAQLRPHYLSITDLLKYGMGLGLFKKFATVSAARNRLLTLISDLKKSCLLLEGDDDDSIKMHDVVHQFAVSLASKERGVFTVANRNYVLEDWLEQDTFGQCTAICLRDCQILKLPQEIECPQLESFILYNEDSSLKIPENFFGRMKKLKLMDLSDVHLCPLPLSIQFLENLQTLCLDRCVLENITAIGELKKLQVLSLIGSTIVQLPMEIRNLTRLQLLDLSKCEKLEVIPPNVLSCLTKLEDLYMGNNFMKWEGEGDHVRGDNASLGELKKLLNLVSLDLHIGDSKIIPEGLFSKKLDRFRIFIGEEWDWSDTYESMRTLKLKLNTSIELQMQLERVKMLLMRTEDLYLDDVKGVKNTLPELDGEGFAQLKHLQVQNSHEMEYIIDCIRIRNVIAFPSLESICVENLNKLEKIWNGPLRKGSFSNLRTLKVGNCNLLRNVFSLSMVRELSKLEEIDVSSCRSFEEIVSEEYEEDETIKLTRLRVLTLENLPQFAGFCSQRMHNIATTNVATIFSKKIQFPNLVDLKLSLNNAEKIWDDQLIELCPFEKLTTLMIDGCGKLATVFTSSMVGSLAQLKDLEICNCNCLEQVIITQAESEEIIFPKLEYLKLRSLPSLVRFCSGNLIECQSLKELRIENCPRLQAFVSSSGTVHQGDSTLFDEKVLFPNLVEIYVFYMHKLKMIWNDEFRADSFCRLKVVTVQHGKQLLKVFPSKLLTRFQSVESLNLDDCDLLEEVFDIEMLIKLKERHEYDVAVIQLRNLDIRKLPKLKHVWNEDPHGILSFENLSLVVVWDCPSLKSLFPASVARNLVRLEMLNIDSCGLEEIVAKEEEFESSPRFVLPRLKHFTLWTLPQLQSFYSGIHTLECPELQALRMYKCDKVEIFSSTPQDQEETCLETHSKFQFQQPFLSLTKFVNLEELTINGRDISKLQHGRFPVPHLYKLKVVLLQFLKDDWTELPFDFLVKFQNLDTLIIGNCDFKEVFPYDMVGEVADTLSRIRHLKLDALPYMRHVWNQESKPDRFLQNLKILQIWQCDSLISLAPSSASFQNLSLLDVYKCEGMLNLISSSTALSLVNLTSMSVRECEQVTEIIVANEGDESQFQSDEIIFRKLASLKLHCLKSLICFFSATCTIKFPSLEEVYASQCPRLKIFSQGVLNAPKLKRVYVTEERDKWRWIGDLNTTIKQLCIEMVGFYAMQHLKLSDFPELKREWHGQLPINFFYKLSKLVIDDCQFSSVCVPSSLLPSLNYLEELEVNNCNWVEQVFGMDWPNGNELLGYLSKLSKLLLIDLPRLRHVWNKVPQGSLDFRNLKMLKIYSCSSLRYVFTPTMSLGLVQLQKVEVKSCVMIEEIVTKGISKQAVDSIIFPLLNSISLESLPGLISFNSGNETVECPALKEITLAECSSTFISTFFKELESSAADGISGPKVDCPYLEDLKLSWIGIKKIWNKRLMQRGSYVENLTSLTVDGCGNLKYLLSSSMVKDFINLKTLEVFNCKLMEEIIDVERFEEGNMGEKMLHKLESLKLKNLLQLTRFCTCDLIDCTALKELWIENCPQLATFISNSAISSKLNSGASEIIKSTLFDEKVAFPNLEELKILGMSGLKIIWHNELRVDSFCKLKLLKIQDLKDMVQIFPPNLFGRFQNVEVLDIRGCDALEEVFDLGAWIDVEESCSKLRILSIWKLPNLKHVWNEDPRGTILDFKNLHDVDVLECPSLKSLFPASIARGLVHLERLRILDSETEEIVAGEEEIQAAGHMFGYFPKLKSLMLRRLPQLKRLYISEWPELKELFITQCAKLQQPILCFTKIVPKLEKLALNGKDLTKICEGHLAVDSFQKLKCLELNSFDEKSAVFQFDLLQRFHNLEILSIARSKFRDLFPSTGPFGKGKYGMILGKIRSLELVLLPNLKNISNPNSNQHQILQTLDTLFIRKCDSLIILSPSPAFLQSLTSLEVVECKRLLSLVTSSAAKKMMLLRTLIVTECNMLKEIVSNGEDETVDEIVFINLRSLELSCLPRLASFCSGNHSFKFPSLTELIVKQCPNMEVFSKGVLSTPFLQSIQLTEEKDKGYWLGNLNPTIKYLHKKMVGFGGLKHLKVDEFFNLKERWHDELPVEFFSDLRSLVVDEGAFSSCAIPPNLLVFLNNLEELDVSNCELLEQVFDIQGLSVEYLARIGLLSKLNKFCLMNLPRLRHLWDEYHQGLLNFKHLKWIKIHNCSSLRMIFTPSLAWGLVHLQEMEVKNCTSVYEIITKTAEEAERDEMIFPLLNKLVLECLPKLTSFYSGREVLQCPSLEKIAALDCPKIELFTSSVPKEQDHIKTDEGNEGRLGKVNLGIPVFCGKVKCPILKELRVEWKSIKEIWHGKSLATELYYNLKVLELNHFPTEYSVFPSNFLERLPNLEKLHVSDACFEEVFSQEGTTDEEHLRKVTQLKELKISKLPQLRHLIRDQYKPGSVIQSLEALEVCECTKLTILVPSLFSFQNMTTIKVSKCQGLLNLITSSTARSLMQLTRLEITECQMVAGIISGEGSEVEEEIVFSVLRHLGLHCLPSLKRFSSGNEAFNFPCLEEVIVRECPKMEYFVKGNLSTPNLKSVQTAEHEDEWRWDGSLNATLQNLFLEMNVEQL